MSNHRLPDPINPEKICRSAPPEGSHYETTVALGDLQDLPPELKSQSTVPIHVQLDFSVDDQGLCVIKGDIAVELTLTCQRCLKPFSYPLNSKFTVSLVDSDEAAKHLPEAYEPLLMTNGEINLPTWIAEELYLALPFAPRHEPSCESYSNNNDGDPEDQVGNTSSPFAALKGKYLS